MDAFPRGTVLMNELMSRLMDAARRVPALREKLYQANFHTTLSGQAMVLRASGSWLQNPASITVHSPLVVS